MAAVAFIGGALFVLQQFAGINGVLYFSSLTFQDVGITSSALASLYVGLTNFAGLDYSILPKVSYLHIVRGIIFCCALIFRCAMCIILNGQARETSASDWKLPWNGIGRKYDKIDINASH